jgi:hypothetical protein
MSGGADIRKLQGKNNRSEMREPMKQKLQCTHQLGFDLFCILPEGHVGFHDSGLLPLRGGKYKCTMCDQTFPSKGEFDAHGSCARPIIR